MPELKTSVRKPRRQRREMAQQDWTLGLEVVHPRAAGIHAGAGEHYVAVPPHCDPEGKAVRSFQTFTTDLNRLADWLQRFGITTVAMQSTEVYWIPVYAVARVWTAAKLSPAGGTDPHPVWPMCWPGSSTECSNTARAT